MDIRCKNCNKKLGANLDGRVEIVCPRCNVFNVFEAKSIVESKLVDNKVYNYK